MIQKKWLVHFSIKYRERRWCNGGAVQYKHFQSVAKEIEGGKLEEVFL